MRFSVFPALLTLIVTIAIGYLAYLLANANSDTNDLIVGIGTGVSTLLTLGCVMGLSLNEGPINVNLKSWSIVAFIVLTIANLCFASFGVSMPYYIIVLILLLVIHSWVVWKLSTITKL